MSAGITVYNDKNKIQIDGAYKNLYLSRKVALSDIGTVSGSFADGELLAAVGGTTSQTIDAYCVNTPTGWSCTVNTFKSGMAVYIFSTKLTAAAHGVGLQVFNENGAVVYDSNTKHPNVIGFGQSEATANSAAKPAVAVCAHSRTETTDVYTYTRLEYRSREVYRAPEWGYYTTTEMQWVPHTDIWGNTRYQYENVTVQKYGMIDAGGWETVWDWCRCDYESLTYAWSEKNFKLSGGNIVTDEVSSGSTPSYNDRLTNVWYVTGQPDNKWYGHFLTGAGVIVDSRSWLVLDVNDL
ncbi:MAG: hypothetical protein IJV46_06815 [Acidaminococcaceae bacterium]|nr:hypothetical protein [Acidaminococcaceae bacterium]